jgi:hypothetical protein
MNILKLVLVSVAALGMTSGCVQKPSCDKTEQYAQKVGTGLGAAFGCKRPDLIAEDIQGKIQDLRLCEEMPTGPIAAIVCRPVSIYVAKLAIDKLPERWECSGGAGGAALQSLVYNACAALPF